MATRRHSRETFGTLLAWYGSWGIFGMLSLLGVAFTTQLLGYGQLSPTHAVVGLLLLAPLTIVLLVFAWRCCPAA